ncbi:MAG: preprotein translocase subunit SecA [Patescibacteria group bacterium]
MTWIKKLFGDPNAREITKMKPIIERIQFFEPAFQALSHEGLKAKTQEFKARLAKGEALDDLLPEAFAAVREASRRVLGQRHYDVQLIGGMVLHRGAIAEMHTGEGKTLTATAPVYLNALTGKGVHVITVNDYLARRDSAWMGQIYHALGLTVGSIQHAGSFQYDPNFKNEVQHDEGRDETGSFRVDMDYLRPVSRRDAYALDITYGTNNEFGFDYLRDNMVPRVEDMVQRPLHYAVIDEVDSILIDEARTPLIISAPAEEATGTYYRFADLVKQLVEKEDYTVDEKLRAVSITEAGISKMEKWLGIENLYIQGGMKMVHHLEQALRAHALYRLDRDYVVKDGEVIIVDEFTGRLMQGRRYSEGLHQAIEAKEHVAIQRESVTMATITFQNYFRLYEKIAGMTGTAATEAEEFYKIYKLEVVSIPTNRPNQRADRQDQVYKNEFGKFKAVAREIKAKHQEGQPVLVGTVSIEKNEIMHELLQQEGVPHEILNAKNHDREAEIIAQAGRRGSVTIATNMAGRGVDIVLGGNPPSKEEAEAVRALGGLYVIGTERHESRRIDNQLRGRSGRQGDPGVTRFYVSMEDDLMRIFGSERMRNMMETLGLPDDEAIENSVLSRSIEAAQKKVEGHNFDIRKHLLEYDDVLNKHRSVVYKRRRDILDASAQPTKEGERPLKGRILEMIESEIEQSLALHASAEDPSFWELDQIEANIRAIVPGESDVAGIFKDLKEDSGGKLGLVERRTHIIEGAMALVKQAYKAFEDLVGDVPTLEDIEKTVLLRSLDDLWVGHLESMDYLRHSIGLQSYGQRDPLVEYKREGYRLFNELIAMHQQRVARTIFKVRIVRETAEQERQKMAMMSRAVQLSAPAKEGEASGFMGAGMSPMAQAAQDPSRETPVSAAKEAGRNDPCPCGSGKKFKKCHGA